MSQGFQEDEFIDFSSMLVSPVAACVAFAVGKGISLEEISAVTGLGLQDLFEPEARISEQVMPLLWQLLGQHFPGKALALEMAIAAPLAFFGDFVRAAKSARNVRDALGTFIQFQSVLASRAKVSLVEEGPWAALEISHPLDSEDGGFAAEAGIAMSARLSQEVLGLAHSLQSVEFAHSAFGPIEDYQRFFKVDVSFNQARNALIFEREILSQNLNPQEPGLFHAIEGHLALVSRRLSQQNEPAALLSLREAVMRLAAKGEYDATALAKEMGMSLRSLQRRAQGWNISVRDLIEQVREANARQMLTDPALSIEEVSYLLGYSTVAAFHRAFRRWVGESPGQYRRKCAVGSNV